MKKKSASRYQPADEKTRTTVALLLRVQPEVAEDLDALAEQDKKPKAAIVSELITEERARRDRRT